MRMLRPRKAGSESHNYWWQSWAPSRIFKSQNSFFLIMPLRCFQDRHLVRHLRSLTQKHIHSLRACGTLCAEMLQGAAEVLRLTMFHRIDFMELGRSGYGDGNRHFCQYLSSGPPSLSSSKIRGCHDLVSTLPHSPLARNSKKAHSSCKGS